MRPRIFIASSKEGLRIAKAIQQNLNGSAHCTVWEQGSFLLSTYPLESLINEVMRNDFGVFVVTPDDGRISQGTHTITARDNVVFEAGLFFGRYGRDRAFLVAPRDRPDLHLPSDLFGMTLAVYDHNMTKHSRNLRAALGTACTDIETAIQSSATANRELQFTATHRRSSGGNFPSKIWIEITNHADSDVVLRANYFKYLHADFRSPVAIPVGNPDREEFAFKFRHPNEMLHVYDHYILQYGHTVDTYVGADPKIDDDVIKQAIKDKQIGTLVLTCFWMGVDLTVRNHEVTI